MIIPLLSLLLATLLSSQFGASLLHPQKVQAAIPSPDGTPLLMIHGIGDSCSGAFNSLNPESTGVGPNAIDTYSFFSSLSSAKRNAWRNIKEIGYYNQGIYDESQNSSCNTNLQSQASHCTNLSAGTDKDGTLDDPIRHLGCLFAWYISSTFPNQYVTILAHSMGGLITRDAIGESGHGGPGFPTSPLYVSRVVTVGTPHGGLYGAYWDIDNAAPDGPIPGSPYYNTQEMKDMYSGSPFMVDTMAGIQAPQGAGVGTYWALMAASNSCFVSSNSFASCTAEGASNQGRNDPWPDGDGAVQESSALAMKANYKILYGIVNKFSNGDLLATYSGPRSTVGAQNTQYAHEWGCFFGNKCAYPPFFLNDGTDGSQQTYAWICWSNCTSTDQNMADMNVTSDAPATALHSLSEIAALLAPANMFTYAANNADGRLEVFARGSDHNIWHIWQTCPYCGWSSWSALQSGYTFNGDPAVGQELDGRLAVFARGSNNAIWVNRQTSPSSGWTGWSVLSQSYGFQGTPAVGRNQDGRLEIFAHGSDGNIWHNWQKTAGDDSSWNGWVPLQSGKVLKGDPVVGINSDGTLEVFAQSTDGNIAHNRQVQPSGSWSGWSGLQSGQSFLGRLSVGRNLDGRLEVYALDWNNNVVHNYQLTGGGWSGWVPLQSQTSHIFNSTAAVGNNADGRLEVFATENAYAEMWHNWQTSPNGSWNGWANLQSGFGFVGANPATANTYDGRLEVFAFGRDNNLWHNFVQVGGGWSGWQPLQSGSSFTPSDCHNTPSDELCDNGFYTNETCPDSQQLETASNPYVSVTIHWSNNCQTNWTSAQILYSQYSLYKVDIERQGNTSDGALTYTDYPGTATWYTNMIWSSNNPARSCAWYFDPNYARVYGPVCTGWH